MRTQIITSLVDLSTPVLARLRPHWTSSVECVCRVYADRHDACPLSVRTTHVISLAVTCIRYVRAQRVVAAVRNWREYFAPCLCSSSHFYACCCILSLLLMRARKQRCNSQSDEIGKHCITLHLIYLCTTTRLIRPP